MSTSFAGATLDGVTGRVDVDNQNGSVEVRGLPAGARCVVPVSRQELLRPDPRLPAGGRGYDVNARTSFGQGLKPLPLTVSGSPSADSLYGQLGDGKCPLTLENSNGSIEILKGQSALRSRRSRRRRRTGRRRA